MTRRPVLCAAALAVAASLAAIPSARAFIPEAGRILAAVVKANSSGQRTTPLQLDVTMRVGEGPPVASGEFLTQTNGWARLELKGGNQVVERHLRRGSSYRASRNGRWMREPRLFLPPLYVLQAASRQQLEADLGLLGVDSETVALAPCGDRDCFVFGDAARVAPPLVDPAEAEATGDAEAPEKVPSPDPALPDSPVAPRHAAPPPTLWVDTESFEIRRLRSAEGLRVEFGPYVLFGSVTVPSWIEVQEPEEKRVRFDVQSVVTRTISEDELNESWLHEEPPSQPLGGAEDSNSRWE